jgi:hypothetical protein
MIRISADRLLGLIVLIGSVLLYARLASARAKRERRREERRSRRTTRH